MKVQVSNVNEPQWSTVNVKSHIPAGLQKLDTLSRNLWWTWNADARDLFRSVDRELFDKTDQNPIEMLRRLSYERLKELAKDEALVARMDKVYNKFRAYMDVTPDKSRPSVAYFCMEY
ncbi:MAG: DUF3417 domain-containing protein, partial [Alloprevotella sp.]|nr:DUF3417 domain-containing protein [Alloprevotella sp.]